MKFEHVLVWEQAHGPVPPGMEIHHVNGNKLDNRIENLQLVTRLEHKRLHSGCVRFDKLWWKRCRRCGWFRPINTDFYVYPGSKGASTYCRRCASALAVDYKRQRRARHRAGRATGTLMPEKTPTRTAGVGEEIAA